MKRIAIVLPTLAMLALPFSVAAADPAAAARACPTGWTGAATTAVPAGARATATRVDAAGNHDGKVCYKAVRGRGNTGAGYNVKDNVAA